ncbi:MAG: hypothetical protein GTN90_02920, partial [Xanthomonadales bacterium]|nr:hypothetical protein [Xanthomonadales bacterium]
MKIVENTKRRLVIEHKPWVLAGMTGAMGLVAIAGAVIGDRAGGIAERML